jgi:uncharacterized protein YlaI
MLRIVLRNFASITLRIAYITKKLIAVQVHNKSPASTKMVALLTRECKHRLKKHTADRTNRPHQHNICSF